ncbi:MAG: DUF2630 family protein [Burkholderiaceae bacterium]
MDEKTILQHIAELVEEEKKLRAADSLPEAHGERMLQLKYQLDQCWDLLRQRRALIEFGGDPAQAATRPAGTVEGYEG